MAGLAACLCHSTLFQHKGTPNAVIQPSTVEEDIDVWEPRWLLWTRSVPVTLVPFPACFGGETPNLRGCLGTLKLDGIKQLDWTLLLVESNFSMLELL